MSVEYHLTTRLLGGVLVLLSLPGLYFNISVFFHLLFIQKTSFYLLCMSKTISNSLVLMVHLFYNGPCAILVMEIGSGLMNGYMNQAIGYGIYLLGPLTQTLISINRFLVVWYFSTRTPGYSNRITVAILLIFWLIAIYLSTIIGFPTNCLMKMKVEALDWTADECQDDFVNEVFTQFTYFIVFLGIFCNSLNLIVIVKLVWAATKANALSSASSRLRHKATIRLFIQTCIQDWIYVFDMFNSVYLCNRVTGLILVFITGLGTNLAIHVADGFVTYMFHHKTDTDRKVSTVSVGPKVSRTQF